MQQSSRIGKLVQAEKVFRDRYAETLKVFKDKGALFLGNHKVNTAIDEARKVEFNSEESVPVTTTVDEKLSHFFGGLKDYIDDSAAVDRTNQNIRVDVVVDGKVLFPQLPIATVIHMKTKVIPDLIALYSQIPTTSTGVTWNPATDQRPGILVSDMPTRFRSEKIKDYKVVVQATEHFPAQVVNDTVDRNVAVISEKKYSGEYSPLTKADKLDKLSKLLAAFTVAAGEANGAKSEDFNISDALLTYLR